MATIKQIAQLAGVSRGTVDRVLNNRGKVNADTEEKIRQIAEAVNYTPNRAGKALAIKKRQLIFGYALFDSPGGNPFFEDLVTGIRHKAVELEEYGVTVDVQSTSMDSPQKQADLLDSMASSGVKGIAITPIAHPIVEKKIQEITAKGIVVVTVNTDLPHCGRIAYVGSDSVQSGAIAAGLMARFTKGQANIGAFIGSKDIINHAERLQGFVYQIKEQYPHLQLVASAENQDDDIISYQKTTQMLTSYPQIDALFLASAGVQGTCRALEDLGLAHQKTIISFDLVPYTRQMVKQGIITATINQQPKIQGAKPLDILLDYLGLDIPPSKEYYYTKTEICIAENI